MKTLYISDLDGTLLDKNAQLPKQDCQILNELTARGVLFTIATARSSFSAGPPLCDLHLPLPSIMINGAYWYDFAKGHIMRSDTISSEASRDMQVILEQAGANPFLFTLEGQVQRLYYASPKSHGETAFLDARKNDGRLTPVPDPMAHMHRPMINLLVIGTQEELMPLYAQFARDTRLSVHFAEDIYTPGAWYLELGDARATKAQAVLALKKELGADRLVVYGDWLNDLSMFAVADEAYAPENACPEAKEMATGIIATGGVARHIQVHSNQS